MDGKALRQGETNCRWSHQSGTGPTFSIHLADNDPVLRFWRTPDEQLLSNFSRREVTRPRRNHRDHSRDGPTASAPSTFAGNGDPSTHGRWRAGGVGAIAVVATCQSPFTAIPFPVKQGRQNG